MNQNIWGSHLWFSLHTITFSYPLNPSNKDKEYYKNFFHSMQHVIPCSICKKNYKRHLIEHPIDDHLNSRKKIVYWLIDIHNMVNAEIGKKIYSYDVIIKKYENVYNKSIELTDNSNVNKNYNYWNKYNIMIFLAIIILLIFIIYFYRK